MSRPYSRSEIEIFAESHLMIRAEEEVAGHIRASFADTIEKLPPWQQILMIESHCDNLYADLETVTALFNKDSKEEPRRVLGFFQPGMLKASFNGAAEDTRMTRNMIVWGPGRGSAYSEATVLHEEGHRIDYILAVAHDRPNNYFSDTIPVWKESLRREMSDRAMRVTPADRLVPVSPPQDRNILNRLRDFMGSVFGAQKSGESTPAIVRHALAGSLYEGYRDLTQHLGYYNNENDHPREAFAEMTAHYDALYARYNGNEVAVDRLLTQNYPILWPTYRDEMIPLFKEHAARLWEQRTARHESFMAHALECAAILGKDADPEALKKHMTEADARGKLHQDAHNLMRTLRALRDPVNAVLDVQRVYEELRWELTTDSASRYRQPFVFNEDEAAQRVQALIAERGINAALELRNSYAACGKSLQALYRYESSFAMIADIPFDGAAVLARYDALRAQGGDNRVYDYVRALPTEAQYRNYEYAAYRYADLVDGLCGQEKRPQDQMRRDIAQEVRSMVDKGQDIVQRADGLKRVERSLSRYYNRLEHLNHSVAEAVGIRAPALDGRRIIAKFLTLYDKGGEGLIAEEATRLTVPQRYINDYVMAREEQVGAKADIARDGADMGYGRLRGLYRPFSVAAADFPPGFREAVFYDAMALVQEGGAVHLQEQIEKLRLETHEAIAAVVKRPAATPAQQGRDI